MAHQDIPPFSSIESDHLGLKSQNFYPWEIEPYYHAFDRRYSYSPYEERFRWGGYFGYRPWADQYSARTYYKNRFGYHIRGGEPRYLGHREYNKSGLGPRGFYRSDARVLDDVNHSLTYSSLIDASDIHVEVKQGVVTLSGHVADRKSKRIAELICDNIAGVKDVCNQLIF